MLRRIVHSEVGSRARARWDAQPPGARLAVALAAAVLVVTVVAAVIVISGGPSRCSDRFCVEVLGPQGEDVDPMTPVRIRLTGEIDRDAARDALRISNAPRGSTAFDGDVLTFRPQWPGFARGVGYDVSFALDKPALPKGVPAVKLDYRFTVGGKLGVATILPADGTEEVAPDAGVFVQFNRSVAPLTVLAQRGPEGVLEFDPPVVGAGYWLNTSLYVFEPAGGWRPSTAYTGRVKAGLTNELGAQLDDDVVFHFTTVSPDIAWVEPVDNSKFVGPATVISVTFNQPVERWSAEGRFSLTSLGAAEQPLAGSFEWLDDLTFVFRSAEALPPASRFEAHLFPGVLARQSAAATKRDVRWFFATAEPPRVTGTTPSEGSRNAQQYGLSITFATPMDRRSVEDALVIEPKPENDLYFGWHPNELSLQLGVRLEASTAYRVTLSTQARDRYGQQLSAPLDLHFTTDRVRPAAHMFRSGSAGTFNAYLDPTVMVSSWNVERLDFKLYRLDRAMFVDQQMHNQKPVPESNLVRAWSETIANPPLNKPVVTSTRLDAQGSRLAEGFYLVTVSSPQIQDPNSDALPFLLSSVNLTTKWTDDELLLWALDMQSGAPFADWRFEVLSQDGSVVARATTDGAGVARVDVPSLGEDHYPGYFISAQKDGRVVFSNTNWNDGVNPYTYGGNIGFSFTMPPLVGHLYMDRPIYRPGETVFVKGVVRKDDDASYSLPAGLQLELRIGDDRGRQLEKQSVTLSDMGTFDTSLALSAEAATGTYQVSLLQPTSETEQYGGIAGVGFRVAEFKKPEFEVNVTTDQESYVNGEQINATVSAQLFFGAPLQNAAVRWQVTGTRYTFRSEKFSSFQTGEYRVLFGCQVGAVPEFQSQRFLRQEGSGRTGAEGLLHFSFPADVAADSFSQNFTVEAWVTDENEQQVSYFTSVPVHKGRFYLGLRPKEYAPLSGRDTSVDLISIDPNNEVVPNVAVEVTAYERKWRTVRERDADGQQRYRSVSDDIYVETIAAGTGPDGLGSFSFAPPRSGQYYLVARSRDARGNTVQSSLVLWSSGKEYASWHVPNDDRFTLVVDKDEYHPGDVARILVAAPFEGDSIALVSQERGRLLAYETRIVHGNSEVLELPIVSSHVPNFYVSVVLFKPPTADNPMPQVKFGLVQVKVSTDEKKLNITIEPSATRVGPRDSVTYTLRTTDSAGRGAPAEVSLALVDKAVLSLQDDFAAPALKAFWSQRPLGVTTASTFTLSVDRANELAKVMFAGGKGGGGGIADQTRTFFPNTAFWEPSLRTDANGRASVEVKLPDTLTTWRLTARGVTGDTKVGEARDEIIAAKDLLVRPALPRFLVAGDEASIAAIVNNLGQTKLDADVSLVAEGIEVVGEATRTVSVPAGGSALVRWPTKAPVEQGEAKILVEARSGDKSDSVALSLPVYAYFTPETVATAGEVTDRASEAIEVPSYVLPDAGGLTVNVTPSLVAGLRTGYTYFEEFPRESNETTVSRFVVALAFERVAKELQLRDVEPLVDDSRALTQRSLQKLYAAQQQDGGWGWWRADASDPVISAYVLVGLGEAKRAGIFVDAGVEMRAAVYLTRELDKARDVVRPDLDLRAFILYGLARAQRGDLGRSFALAEQNAGLSNTAKAWLALAIKLSGGGDNDPRLTGLLTDLRSASIASATGNHWEEEKYQRRLFGSSVSVTAQALQAFAAFEPNDPLIDNTVRWLMMARRDGHWTTSYETAKALLAITDFMLVRRDVQGSFGYRVSLNGRPKLEGAAETGEVQQEEAVTIDMKDLARETLNDLQVSRAPVDASGRLYYTAQLHYYTPASEIEAASNGIGVSHQYFRAEVDADTPVRAVELGDVVKVKLTLVAPADLNFLVLEDYLPAGLEPIDTSLKITPLEFRWRMAEEQRKSYQVNKRYSPFGHVDVRDNRVALFARLVTRGVYEYTYFARATTAGTFRLPPATAYEQYFPDVFGRSDGGTFIVRPSGE